MKLSGIGLVLFVFRKQAFEKSLVVAKKAPCDGKVFGLFVFGFREARFAKRKDFGSRIGQQNRRVRGDDELRMLVHQLRNKTKAAVRSDSVGSH